jgi:hypothetical protein
MELHQACQPPEGGFSGASYVEKCRNRDFRRIGCAIRNCSPVPSSLDFGVFRVAGQRVFVTGVSGYPPGTSALTLVRDLEIMVGNYRHQPLSDFPRPEQRNAFRSESLLGDLDQLLERNFAGIAKELDRTRRFSQECAASEVVNDGAATRPPVAR